MGSTSSGRATCSSTTASSPHELVDEAPHHARVISRDGLDQQALNELLVGYGRAGFDVVRLKGGDPFVFGRGGEEALALSEAGIETEVVPGVSSIAAVPAAAGIPVTHRGVSDRVTIASCQGADGSDAEYARLAAIGGTLILFMGLGRVERVVEGLLAAGLPPETPAAAVSRGSLPGPGGCKDDARCTSRQRPPGWRARRCWSSATSPRSSSLPRPALVLNETSALLRGQRSRDLAFGERDELRKRTGRARS